MTLYRALGLKGEVIVPSFTFIAGAHSLSWQGLKPVFADIDPLTHNISVEHVKSLIGPETSAIAPVHLWGRPSPIRELESLTSNDNVDLLFDAAHAFNVAYDNRKIGVYGKAEVFSFHATKTLNGVEGGAITTNDESLARELELMINFGFDGLDSVVTVGTNAKMNELSACMALSSLEGLERNIANSQKCYRAYSSHLVGIPGLSLLSYEQVESPNYQYMVLEINEPNFGMSRDMLAELLWAENARVRRYFFPGCHLSEPYRRERLYLPETEKLSMRVMCLPSGGELDLPKIRKLSELISFIQCNAEQILRKIEG